MLFVVGCTLIVVCCFVGWLLTVVDCLMLWVVKKCLPCVVSCSLLVACCGLFVACVVVVCCRCLSCTAYVVVCCVLCVVYGLSSVIDYSSIVGVCHRLLHFVCFFS